MEDSQEEVMTGRFFTNARRFKQVLGSLPDGTKIPGGPYTYSQVGFMVGTAVLAWITSGIWSTGSTIGDLLIGAGLAYGMGLLAGRAPATRRSPMRLIGGAWNIVTHPGPGGRWRGKKLQLSRNAQRIQRERKASAKKLAREKKAAGKKRESAAEISAPQHEIPAGHGSSLNRLLEEQGLLDSERIR